MIIVLAPEAPDRVFAVHDDHQEAVCLAQYPVEFGVLRVASIGSPDDAVPSDAEVIRAVGEPPSP